MTTPGARQDVAYVFDNENVHSREQHRCLAGAFDAITTDRLSETGVTAGWRCLEVGSGGGSVAEWLAEKVGSSGEVVVTDVKTRHLDALAGTPNITVLQHDAETDPLPEAEFDLIVARLVLQHLPRRESVLAALVRALKPGGWLQIDEFDTSYEPPLLVPGAHAGDLYEKFLATKSTVMRRRGGDPTWGSKAASSMRAAGLVGVDPQPHIRTRSADTPDLQLQLHHTHHLRDGLVAAGMTEQELDEVRALMRDPSFRAASSIFYSVHGRRPEKVPA